jgi:dipeptide transport system permease protein
VLSRIIYGARIALMVALIAGTATCLIGTALGLVAGYFRGWADAVISRLVDIWMSFPPVLFAILLIAVLGTGLTSIIVAVIVIDWTRFARVIRAEAMSQGVMDYVASAQVAGRTRLGTMLAEILPNVLPTMVALLTLEMGIAVIVEAILSFVNLSISTDSPTWGGMIAEGRSSIHQAWWVLVFPLIALFLTVLSFSQLGEGLKDRFDPVLR